ncbi:hypothetical protein XENOCAPTIV_023780 [Xenoophorus captivus]|uniref:Exocyst complex component 5 n=1 Tax=Xenoophorus captivus TaxID=1517983 RepID=A0ABV0QKJ7_9TELE
MATTAQLFEEPFDADEYIERLAWRTPGGGSKGGAEAFDPKRVSLTDQGTTLCLRLLLMGLGKRASVWRGWKMTLSCSHC